VKQCGGGFSKCKSFLGTPGRGGRKGKEIEELSTTQLYLLREGEKRDREGKKREEKQQGITFRQNRRALAI